MDVNDNRPLVSTLIRKKMVLCYLYTILNRNKREKERTMLEIELKEILIDSKKDLWKIWLYVCHESNCLNINVNCFLLMFIFQ